MSDFEMNFEMELVGLKEEIDETRDNLKQLLMNSNKEDIESCKGWIESVEGHLNEAESDVDFALSLYRNNRE